MIRKYHREAGSCLRRVQRRVHVESARATDDDGDENVTTARPLSTGASHRACSRGCDTRTLRVWCPRAAAPGSAKNKGREDSTGFADRSIKHSAELVEKCPPTTRHKVRYAVTTAEVKSPKLQTCDEHQPRGEWPS